VFIDHCDLGDNSDSGALDSKADWGQISNCTISSLGGRAMSQHCMGSGNGPWRGLRSINNVINVPYGTILNSGTGFTEAYQAEGVLEAYGDTITLASGARLAVTAWQDTQGSGAPGSYPRLGSITTHGVHDVGGTMLTGPTAKGDDATHHTTIVIDTNPSAGPVSYGVSHGSVILASVRPDIVRTYNAGQRDDAIAGGFAQQLSYKPADDAERTAIRNNTPANKATLKAYWSAIPDVAHIVPDEATYDHERDNDTGAVAANYLAESAVVKGWLDEVNATRVRKILWTPTTTGDLYRTGSQGPWYVPSCDKIGADIYNSARIPEVAAFAKSKGKPWSMPEWGQSVTTDGDDPTCLARINADSATITSLPSSALPQPSPVIWFDANHNDISTGHPNSVAKLLALCTS
jgi:hypothetical protein